MRETLGRLMGIGVRVFAGGCLLGLFLLGVLQFDGVSTWLVGRLAGRFNPYPGSLLTVERVSGSWIRSLRLEGVLLTAAEDPDQGSPEITLESLMVRFRLLPLLVRRLDIREGEVSGLRAALTQRPDSLWDFLLPFQTTPAADEGKGGGGGLRFRSGPIRIENSSLQVTFAPDGPSVEPDRLEVEELALSIGRLEGGADGWMASLDTVHTRFLPPGEALDRVVLDGKGSLADGRVVISGFTLRSGASDMTAEGTLLLPGVEGGEVEEIDFRLQAASLAFRDLSGFMRALDPTVIAGVDLRLQGRASRVEVSGHGAFSDGGRLDLEGAFTPFVSGPVEYRMLATARDLRLESFLGEGSIGGVLHGQVAVDVGGLDLAHLNGDISGRVEGLRFQGRAAQPLGVSGGFVDGEANLEVEAGADGLGAVRFSVGGHPLDPEPSLRLQGDYRQSSVPADREGNPSGQQSPLEQAGIRALESRISLQTEGFSVDSAVAELEVEILGGFLADLPLEGGSLGAAWDRGAGTFRLDQPLASGRVTTTGTVAWRADPRAGEETGRVLSYSLPDLVLREVDLFHLLGDTVSSRVNAVVALAGIGRDPGTMEADVLIHLRESQFRGMALGSAVAGLRSRPLEAESLLILDSLRFAGMELAPGAGLPVRLNGLARGRMEGLDPRTGTISGDLSLTASQIGNALVDSGGAVLSLSDGDLRFSGQLHSADGIARLKGSAYPFADPLEFRLEEGEVRALNLGPILGQERLQSALNLDFSLLGSGSSLEDLDASGQLAVHSSTVNRGDILGGEVRVEARGGEGTLQGQIRTGAGEVTLRTSALLGATLDGLRAEGDLNLPDLGGFLGQVDAELAANGTVAATWTPRAGLAFASRFQGRIGGASIDTLVLGGVLEESALRLDTLRLRSDILRADGRGRLVLRDSPEMPAGSDLAISAAVLDLSPLGPLFGLGELAARSGQGELRLTGPAGAPSLAASIDLGPWLLKGFSGDSALVKASYDPGEMTLAVRLRAPEGRGSIDLALRADPRPDEARGVLERMDVSTHDARWTLDAQVPFSWRNGPRIDGLVLRSSHQGRISVDGIVDPRGDQDLTVRLEEASVSGLAKLLGLEDLTLLADGQLRLTGPASSPEAQGDFSLALASDQGAATSIDASFSLAGGELRLDAEAKDTAGGRLTLESVIPLAFSLAPKGDTSVSLAGGAPASPPLAKTPVDITLLSEAFDISWAPALFPRGIVAALGGVLSADARATGPIDQLVLEGRVGLRDGMIRVPASGIRFQKINLAAELRDRRVQITEGSVSSGSGSAEIQGFLTLLGLGIDEMDITARMNHFLAWNTPLASADVTGNLSLRGSVKEPLLTGNLNLEGSKVGLDGLSSENVVEAVELTDEDYRMLEDYFGYQPQRREVVPSRLMERFGLDLTVSFDRAVWVNRSRQPRVALEIRGELEIKKAIDGEVQAFGTIETLPERSYFREFGRRFSVQAGELTLTGDPAEFSFSMDARWEVPSYSNPDEAEVVVNLEVTGNAESMELTLSSDPEMDEADIVSYLATGKPQDALAPSGGDTPELSSLGAAMAAGALAGALEGYASDAVALDVVEIKVDPGKGPTLIAGRYVSPNLYLGFRQPVTFGESNRKTRSENQTSEVELEYRWFRWLTMNVQGGASEIRLFLKARYAY